MSLKFSVTSIMLPHLDLPQTCALLKQHGYDGLELRVRAYTGDPQAAPSPWGRHLTDISPDNVKTRAGEIKTVLADHGLTLAAFASNATARQLDVVRQLAEGAVATGCPLIRIAAQRSYNGETNYFALYDEAARAFEQALAITRPYGIKCIIETHGGSIFVSASLTHRLVSLFDPAEIGVLYDPQNNVMDGFETIPLALDLMGPYLAHLHIGGHACVPSAPDANGTVTWTYPACRLNEGRYNYPLLLKELHKRQYRGFISVEDFDNNRPPEQCVAEAISYLRKIDPS
jgi:sugar phosphate isomerase/epimerase